MKQICLFNRYLSEPLLILSKEKQSYSAARGQEKGKLANLSGKDVFEKEEEGTGKIHKLEGSQKIDFERLLNLFLPSVKCDQTFFVSP